MGLNINKSKEKLAGAQNFKDSMKQSKMQHNQKMDYINSSITVISSIAELTNTILSAKEETKRQRIQAETRQKELEQQLDLLKTELDIKRIEMEKEVATMRIQSDEQVKKLDYKLGKIQEKEETKRLKINKEHEARMALLNMQREVLHMVMGLYQQHATDFSNAQVYHSFEDIGRQMQACIMTINTALQVRATSNYIDMP